MEALHSRRTYDDRIQEAIWETGDRDLFPELNIPRSTIRSWIHRGPPDEVFLGIGDEVSKRLAEARDSARKKRMKENRAAGCGLCIGDTESRALLLQRPRPRMS